ncbi:MAG: response regulator [Fuerstiella sp.]
MDRRARLLLVEDDLAQRRTLEALMTREGFEVTVCETIATAREHLAVERFAVCILDHRLPDRTSIDLLRGLRRDVRPQTRFIINTAYGSFSSAKEAVNLGAFAYIEKLGEPRELVGAVHSAARDYLSAELKHAKDEIRLQVRLLDAVQLAVIATDLSFRAIYWNRFAETMYGCSSERILREEDVSHLILSETDAGRIDELMAVLRSGHSWTAEYELPGQNGSPLKLETTISPVMDPQNQLIGLIGVSSDISERERLRQEHADLQARFFQAQKMESVGRLAGGIAHDFNNILCATQISTELLRNELNGSERGSSALELIRKSTGRAQDLIRQLLAFSRKQQLDMRTLNLNTVIQEFSDLLRLTLREDISIELSGNPDLEPIRGDVRQLEQVILNLAINAQDAMPDGGHFRIATAMAPADDVLTPPDGEAVTGRCVTVTVSDTGEGIPQELQDKIFEPFFSNKPNHQGTGLGLATVLGVVRQHGGNIRVSSTPGSGTVFHISFPAVIGPVSDSPPPVEPVSAGQGTETILLVEDNDHVRSVTQSVLEGHGYTVYAKRNGPEALAFQNAFDGQLDLLLTDFVMPMMNGRELAEQALNKDPTLKVLYMSGYTDEDKDDLRFLDTRRDQFIDKPFSIQQLTSKIREILDQPDGQPDGQPDKQPGDRPADQPA